MEKDIVCIDKPKGITSFDVIRILRKKMGVRKMGHAGTLDPFATGLLIIGLRDATKKLGQFLKLSKTYEAEIVFGTETNTGDSDGEILRDVSVLIPQEVIDKALRDLKGVQKIPVPIFSAVKRGGEPLYKKARRGEVFDVPIKDMDIKDVSLVHVITEGQKTIARVIFDVASGVYIRSVVVELGKRLGVPAMTRNLRRLRIGDYSLSDAVTLDTI